MNADGEQLVGVLVLGQGGGGLLLATLGGGGLAEPGFEGTDEVAGVLDTDLAADLRDGEACLLQELAGGVEALLL